MTLHPWVTLSDESLVHYKIFDVRKRRRRSPRNGQEIGFFLIDTFDWVNIVAFTPNRELIVIRQYRQGPEAVTLEVPGGVVDPGEDPADAARRELREESGYAATTMTLIGSVNPNPALFSNRCSVFLAEGCEPAGELQMDPGEDIEVGLIPWVEIDDYVGRGEFDHSLVITALYLFRVHASRADS